MSIALDKSFELSRAFARTSYDAAMRMKAEGTAGLMVPGDIGLGSMGSFKDQSRNRESYASFRNWLYSAVNAIALEAAGQPVQLGRMLGEDQSDDKRSTRGTKAFLLSRMPANIRAKAIQQEYELVWNHPLVTILEEPNTFQHRWQFVYSYAANLLLTGWSYVISDTDEHGRLLLYSIPTTWVRPKHDKGPFSEFYISNPKNPTAATGEPIDRANVAFAYLPNPSDPLSALAPATSQMPAIRIDDYIQGSQEQHFRQGIHPSVIVTMGKNPHPDVPGGIRPRLNASQRRQVHAAIAKAMGGIANYGNPAIVDGMIEGITRFSPTEPEMGWTKSEEKVRTRLLSAFGVHPYILGEPVRQGGYGQVHKIEERFAKRVNTYLDLLSQMMTVIVAAHSGAEMLVWWEACRPLNPEIEWRKMQFARTNGDITRNELRAEMGLPPDEDSIEESIRGTMGGQITQLLKDIGQGFTTPNQASAMLVQMGIPEEAANQITNKPQDHQLIEGAVGELRSAVEQLRSVESQCQELSKHGCCDE